jgi:hypothetical protein
MRVSGKSTEFIIDLNGAGSGRARLLKGAGREVCAALISSAVAHERPRDIGGLVLAGEYAQSHRDAEGLENISRRILEVADNEEECWIGNFYRAIGLNRQGPSAYPQANRILEGVADHGSPALRPKAALALGINIRATGDHKGARSLYDDALKMVDSREGGPPLAEFLVGCQRAFLKHIEGDGVGAVRDFTAQMALAPQIGPQHAPFAHHYFNNLVAALVANGQIREAEHYAKILRVSPFADIYREWGATCAALDEIRARQRPRRYFAGAGRVAGAISLALLPLGSLAAPGSPPAPTRQPAASEIASASGLRESEFLGVGIQESERGIKKPRGEAAQVCQERPCSGAEAIQRMKPGRPRRAAPTVVSAETPYPGSPDANTHRTARAFALAYRSLVPLSYSAGGPGSPRCALAAGLSAPASARFNLALAPQRQHPRESLIGGHCRWWRSGSPPIRPPTQEAR